jgi:hypothetical protein
MTKGCGVIHIRHSSMRGRCRAPAGFGTQEVSTEQLQTLETVAVSTFSDMVSAGHTFQAALAAVYYTGIVHALEATS